MRSVVRPCRLARSAAAWAWIVLGMGNVALAGDWPCWRGPTTLGYADDTKVPLTWGGKRDENVVWKTPLRSSGPESPGFSSPIVCRDRVFITTVKWRMTLAEEAMKREAPEQHVTCYQV